jgi:lysozyme
MTDIVSILEKEEGFVPHVYKDHLGYWTIGHGILVDERKGGGITIEESRYLLNNRPDTKGP